MRERNDETGSTPHGSESYFEEIAPAWDDLRKSLFPDSLRERVCDLARVGPGSVAVDVGAGTGFLSHGLLARGARVIAIDRSPNMLAQLERRAPGAAGRLETRVGSDSALPVEPGSVDAVVANMFLHHVESPSETLSEMTRLLATGGRLVVADLDRHSFDFLLTEQHDRWPGFHRQDVRRWLVEAGLAEVGVEDAVATCRSRSERGDALAEVSIFVAFGVRTSARRPHRGPIGIRV